MHEHIHVMQLDHEATNIQLVPAGRCMHACMLEACMHACIMHDIIMHDTLLHAIIDRIEGFTHPQVAKALQSKARCVPATPPDTKVCIQSLM